MNLTDIILILGGLGLFLFGMKMMSDGLQTIAGNRLQGILQKATSNRIFAVLVGITATVALNSSTASTVMTVSFVNSGMMNLTQAIGIIMGANVGTTFSAQLVAFRIDSYAPLFIFVGIILYLFVKKKSVKNIGYVILGFGILFFGITTMGGPLRGLANLPGFNDMLVAFQNPFLALLAGFAFTAAVQSSTATTGILVAMYISGVPIPFETGAFIILGTNIGTSITTLIASIPANRESKRAALFHITFDIIGSAVFGTLIFVFPGILGWFQATWAEPARQIAMFHTLYNFATMFLLLPFVGYVAKLLKKVVPGEDKIIERGTKYLDWRMVDNPNMAIDLAQQELLRMAEIAGQNIKLAIEGLLERDEKKLAAMKEQEDVVDELEKDIMRYLARVSQSGMSNKMSLRHTGLLHAANDIERVSDHADNIADLAIEAIDGNIVFSDEAADEIRDIFGLVTEAYGTAILALKDSNMALVPKVKELEAKIDAKEEAFRATHIQRLREGRCTADSGVIFLDIIINFERIGDHSNNISNVAQGKL
ncbi:MAG: Na/Pi cotransporter family protein [Defluviitaleaceae bacterium]|nr:Na/Pi cotransporter family protein [Defluviitaleaceae bacterium]